MLCSSTCAQVLLAMMILIIDANDGISAQLDEIDVDVRTGQCAPNVEDRNDHHVVHHRMKSDVHLLLWSKIGDNTRVRYHHDNAGNI